MEIERKEEMKEGVKEKDNRDSVGGKGMKKRGKTEEGERSGEKKIERRHLER